MRRIGFPVLVYRLERDQWEGSSLLLEIQDEAVSVLTTKSAAKFRSKVVKTYLLPADSQTSKPRIEPERGKTTSNNTYIGSLPGNMKCESAQQEEESLITVHVKQ